MANQCPVCNKFIETVLELQRHVNSHFAEDERRILFGEEKCTFVGCEAYVSCSSPAYHTEMHLAEKVDMEDGQAFASLKRRESDDDTSGPSPKRRDSGSSKQGYAEKCDINKLLAGGDLDTQDCKTEVPATLLHKAVRGGDGNGDKEESEIKVKRVGDEKAIKMEMTTLKAANSLKDSTRTSGLICKLRDILSALRDSSNTAAAYLADVSVDHISSDLSDAGWGCGYRNLQMVISYLVHKDSHVIANLGRKIPDILGLQRVIEEAWGAGFDPLGATQLNRSVVKRRKWVGTTEIYTLLTYLGVRCSIIDFRAPSGPRGSHPRLFSFIASYFEPQPEASTSASAFDRLASSPIHLTEKPPIYLQHQGHSRTIVGIEKLKDGKENLLVFDPAKRVTKKAKEYDGQAQSTSAKKDALLGLIRPFRVTDAQISKHKRYQIVVLGDVHIQGKVTVNSLGERLTPSERRERMVVNSKKVD